MIDVKVPVVGESVTYAELTNWMAKDGAYVEKDQEIAEFDSDKASFTIQAEESGRLKIIVKPGKVNIGDLIAQIDTTSAKPVNKVDISQKTSIDKIQKPETIENNSDKNQKRAKNERPVTDLKTRFSPLAAKMAEEYNLNPDDIAKDKILRITKNDVLSFMQKKDHPAIYTKSRETVKKELTPLRRKLAERLVRVKNETAMLTTYNEADMSRILSIRREYGERFQKKYGMKLGLMSFFAKAAAIALQEFREVNASIDGDYIVYHEYVDLGIAVSTEKGLMVPVIHNVESLGIPELEKEIQLLAEKARTRKITIEEMTGGTFTISNGGVFGSLFSSPIINPPQAAILGMHKIQERPVGIEGRIVLRPMMYFALSYDHRLIDGKDSVTFLVRIKELIEEPCKLSAECAGIVDRLLGI